MGGGENGIERHVSGNNLLELANRVIFNTNLQ